MKGIKYPATVSVIWPGMQPIECCTDHASLLNGMAILCEIEANSFVIFPSERTECVICYDATVLRRFATVAEAKLNDLYASD